MKYFVLSEDDLLELAEKSFVAGCEGYLDLKESSCPAIVSDFMHSKNHKLQSKMSNQIFAAADFTFSATTTFPNSTFFISSSVEPFDFH